MPVLSSISLDKACEEANTWAALSTASTRSGRFACGTSGTLNTCDIDLCLRASQAVPEKAEHMHVRARCAATCQRSKLKQNATAS